MEDEQEPSDPGDDCPICHCPVILVGQGDMYDGELGDLYCPACGWVQESE